MITVAGRVPIKPEKHEEAKKVFIKMVQATQPEAGCLQYHFYTDLEDPNIFHVFEEWNSQEELEAHFQTPHMAELKAALPDILAGEPAIMKYDVSAVSRLM